MGEVPICREFAPRQFHHTLPEVIGATESPKSEANNFEWELSKENIKPLKSGRSVELLNKVLISQRSNEFQLRRRLLREFFEFCHNNFLPSYPSLVKAKLHDFGFIYKSINDDTSHDIRIYLAGQDLYPITPINDTSELQTKYTIDTIDVLAYDIAPNPSSLFTKKWRIFFARRLSYHNTRRKHLIQTNDTLSMMTQYKQNNNSFEKNIIEMKSPQMDPKQQQQQSYSTRSDSLSTNRPTIQSPYVVQRVDLRTFTFDVLTQDVLTRDSVTVAVEAVIYYRIFDPILSVVNVKNVNYSTRLLAQTTLRNVLGTIDMCALLTEREHIAILMQETLDIATDVWGMKVERVEIKDVRLPLELQRSMAAEAEATREANAKIILALGEKQASSILKLAALEINNCPIALQLRYLHTLNCITSGKQSTILFPIPIELIPLVKG
ncbi:SPFH domain / Band 7 family protein,putative [Schistosoma mansoni]|uniref:SPFH domain / Band 7 family protein,putative n=1 Tax=Schistosoma mansoni TaxID=6183 RepID=UPI00022C862D|nr:SPFH domain / Band 7 family protein,putative [Schistosoma mansoni]|eukprot:XP_018645097.1 SPFH domain / Band 7 family protein,putative [Schistosoma mansoni]